jgi:exosortase A
MSAGDRVPQVGRDAVAARPQVSAWTAHLVVFGGLLALLVALYWRAVVAAVTVWWVSPTYSHCFLIIPVSAYLIWARRHRLASLTPVSYPRALLLALPIVLASFVGTLASINEIQQLAFIAFVQIIALGILGPTVYRIILFPSLYLFFLVPMGEYLIGPLQSFTTRFIDVGLNVLGILHYTEGNVIELANGSFQVAEACAGLRFLIATIAVGVLFVHLTYSKWHKITLYMIASVVVPIIGNGLRALGIVLLAHFSDNRIATGADHLIYGWGFSVIILTVLMIVGMRFADRGAADDAKSVEFVKSPAGRLPLTAIGAAVVISIVPSILFWRAPVRVDSAAFDAPLRIPGWVVTDASRDWTPLYAAPDAKIAFAMRDHGSVSPPVDVFVDYYATSDDRHSLITSTNKLWDEDQWHPVFDDEVHAVIGSQDVKLGEVEIASGGVSRLIWWTYSAGGRFTTSAFAVKLNRMRTAVVGGEGSALVAASTPVDVDTEIARARLRRALSSLGGLEARIVSAAK